MADNNFYTKQTFLAALMNKLCAGSVQVWVPAINGEEDTFTHFKGFLSEEFTLSLGNTWGSVLPDAESANQIGQILGLQSQITWIQSSATAWKSTQPLEFDMDIYLVTLTPDQSPSILEDAKQLMKLAALYVKGDDWATAKIHGGYHVDYALSNNQLWTNWVRKGDKNGTPAYTEGYDYASDVGTIAGLFSPNNTDGPTGTVRLLINNKMLITNLLINKISVTPSSAYVNPTTPLYIKLSVSFRTSRALLTTDIDNILGTDFK